MTKTKGMANKERKEFLRFWIYKQLGDYCHYNDEHKVVVPLEDLVIRQYTDRYVCPVGGQRGISLAELEEIWSHLCRKGEKYALWCKACVKREDAVWKAELKAELKKITKQWKEEAKADRDAAKLVESSLESSK